LETVAWTLLIFMARVVDVGLGTIRVQFIVRRQKLLAALTGFVEVLIFILIVSRVIRDVENLTFVLAYAAGFAVGTLVGMTLTEKLSKRVVQATVICHSAPGAVEEAMRQAGFALTRYQGVGRDGPVDVLDVVCSTKGLPRLNQVVAGADPQAFLYTQELTGLHGGYIYGLKGKL
jgi:uncharacterized protein YebE (UPF0316 family)